MPIESISIFYVGVGVLFVVLFCKAVEIIVERATSLFVGKTEVRVTSLFVDEKDVIDLLRMGLNELNIKINALRIKLDGDLDALKVEVNALNSKLESAVRMTEQSNVMASPIPMLEDTWGNSEATWTRGALVSETSIAPTIGESSSNDTWTRDTVVSDAPIVPTISEVTSNDTFTRDVGKSDSVVNTKGAITEVAMAQVHQDFYPKEIAPNCTKCSKPMLLRQIHPSRSGHYKGDFECETCGLSVRKFVTIASGHSRSLPFPDPTDQMQPRSVADFKTQRTR
jgi:hypothetical protein